MFLVIILVLIGVVFAEENCPLTFSNTEATVTFLKGEKRLILGKCAGAELKNAVEIKVKNQDVPVIEHYAVNYIDTLQSVVFDNCLTYKVKDKAFWNVNNLMTIKILNNQIDIIAAGVFSNVTAQNIELTGNGIYNIERGAFNQANQLRIVKLNRNKLTHIFSDWFVSSQDTISTIDLSENLISYIPIAAFAKYNKLQNLLLNSNQITAIHADAFKGLGKIRMIDLGFNHIAELKRYVTDPFKSSRLTFKIHNNRINYLQEVHVQNLQYAILYLHSNPWKCACYQKMLEWVNKYQVDIVLNRGCKNNELYPVCIEQERFPKKCTQEVDKEISNQYFINYNKVPCDYN